MFLQVLMHDIKTVETGAVVVGFHEDVRPLQGGAGLLDWVLCGALSRLIIEGRIRGALEEAALLTAAGKIAAPMIFMIGLGPGNGSSEAALRTAARRTAESLVSAGVERAAVDLFPLGAGRDRASLQAIREGFTAGSAGRDLQIDLLAPDTESFEQLSRALKT